MTTKSKVCHFTVAKDISSVMFEVFMIVVMMSLSGQGKYTYSGIAMFT